MDASLSAAQKSSSIMDSVHRAFDDAYDACVKPVVEHPYIATTAAVLSAAAIVAAAKGRISPWLALGTVGGGALLLAGCSKPNDSNATPKPQPGSDVNPPMQRVSDPPVVHGNPNQQPPEYPGGIGPDAGQVGRMMQAAGPYPNMLYNLFLNTYNSRSNENWLPASLQLREVSPQAKPQITQWHLMGDSALYARQPSLGNRDLKPISDRVDSPGSSKDPGHMYAFGVNGNCLPIDVLEYYRDTMGGINYYRQYLISYSKDQRGDTIIDVSDYVASNQTQTYGPHKNIAGIDHTLMGVTRYYEDPNNNCMRAERYQGYNLNQPIYSVNFDNRTRSAGTLAPQFYFYDLFGP